MIPQLLFVLGPACFAQEAPLAIVDVNVLPMDDAEGALELLRGQTVLVRAGRIERVGPTSEVPVPDDARVVDGNDKFLVPGFVDAHTHTFNAEDFELHVANGVTTVWEMSGNPQLLTWRTEIESKERLGPRLFVTAPQLKVRPIPFSDMEVAAGTPEEARRLVEGMAADGYDFVKVWGPLSDDVLASIGAAAAETGLRITGHLPRGVGLEATLAHGMAAIAHVEEYWNKFFRERPDESRLAEAVALTAEANAVVVTTLVTYENIARALQPDLGGLTERPELRFVDPVRRFAWGPENNAYRGRFDADEGPGFAAALTFQLRIAHALNEGGVPLLAGTDAGGFQLSLVPGFALHRELELLVEAGLTPLEALRGATSLPGRFLAPEDPAGVVAVGRRADLVLLRENPLEDITHTRSIQGVVVAGRWLDRLELDRRLDALAARNERTAAFVEAALGAESVVDVYAAAKAADASGEPLFQEAPMILLGFVLFQTGRQDQALEVLEIVMQEIPDGYVAYFTMAVAAFAEGDVEGARYLLNAVLERSPDHRAAQRMLAGLER